MSFLELLLANLVGTFGALVVAAALVKVVGALLLKRAAERKKDSFEALMDRAKEAAAKAAAAGESALD